MLAAIKSTKAVSHDGPRHIKQKVSWSDNFSLIKLIVF
jgi:hypothetical protein